MNMNKINGFWFFAFSIVALFVLVSLTRLPALNEWFNLRNDDSLGDAFNGLTAPFIGLVSIYLLYKALMAQNETNKSQIKATMLQQVQYESSIISDTLNRIDLMISEYQFISMNSKGNLEVSYKGLIAMTEGLYPEIPRQPKATSVLEVPHLRSIAFILDRILNVERIVSRSNIPLELKTEYESHIESYGRALASLSGWIGMIVDEEKMAEEPAIKTFNEFFKRFQKYAYNA